MSSLAGSREFGEGPLSRAVCVIYTLLVVEGLMLLTGAPGLTLLVLLGADPSNAPLLALSGLALGPSVGAGVYALHHRSSNLADLRPAAAFWRGYRLNAKGVLRVWLPWLVWLAVLSVSLANFGAAGVPGWWGRLLLLVAALATLWAANATVIASLFWFRTGDVLRLAAHFLLRCPAVTLANAALLFLGSALTVVTSEAVLALFGSVFALTLVRNARALIDAVRAQFVVAESVA